MDIMAAPLVGFNPDRHAGEINEPLFGGNMAFRRAAFEKYGVFRTDLGPSPNHETPRPNEDTDFGRRVLAGGGRLFYEPSAVVFHPVTASRLQKAYFLDWWFDKGRADILMSGIPQKMRTIGGVPWRFVRRVIHWTMRWMFALEPCERFSNRLKVQWLLGMIAECRHQSGPNAVARIKIERSRPLQTPKDSVAVESDRHVPSSVKPEVPLRMEIERSGRA
jgi:hypothetical protein